MSDNEKIILESNVDTTITKKSMVIRKPFRNFIPLIEQGRFSTIFGISFGYAIYSSILKAFSSLFEWKNLPDNLFSNDIELILNQSGRLKFIKAGSKFYFVRISATKYDNYNNIIKSVIFEPWLPNITGKTTEIFANEEVRNNTMGDSIIRVIFPYLDVIDDSMDNLKDHANIISGKFIFKSSTKTDDDNKILVASMNQWITSNEPIKVMHKSLMDGKEGSLEQLEISDSVISFITIVKFNIQQALNALGIPNNSQEDKKERLVTNEVIIQNIVQSNILEDMLDRRKYFVMKANEKFGLNMEIDYRESVKKMMEGINEKNPNGENTEVDDE